jgi:folylpolyglutamate synthase/dihydropteroate synthase
MRDKAISEMAEILFPTAERVIVTRPGNPRSALAEEILQAASRTGAEIEAISDVTAALERARDYAGTERAHVASGISGRAAIVVTGSIYLVGEAMQALGHRA